MTPYIIWTVTLHCQKHYNIFPKLFSQVKEEKAYSNSVSKNYYLGHHLISCSCPLDRNTSNT